MSPATSPSSCNDQATLRHEPTTTSSTMGGQAKGCAVAYEDLWQRLRQLSVARQTAYGFVRVSRVLEESQKICGYCNEYLNSENRLLDDHDVEFLALIRQEAEQIAQEQSRKLNSSACTSR